MTVYALGFTVIVTAVIELIFIAILVAVSYIDIDSMVIPDRYHIIIALLALARLCFNADQTISCLVGALIVSVPMLIIAVFTSGFGGADIKLMAAAGFMLGAKSIAVAFIVAVVIMGSIGFILIIRRAIFNISYKNKVAFCPALALGCVTAMFFDDNITSWYLSLL